MAWRDRLRGINPVRRFYYGMPGQLSSTEIAARNAKKAAKAAKKAEKERLKSIKRGGRPWAVPPSPGQSALPRAPPGILPPPPQNAPQSAQERYYESLLKKEQVQAAAASANTFWGRHSGVVGRTFKHPIFWAIAVLVILGGGMYYYLSFNALHHQGPFTYQIESFYGPYFTAIGNFVGPLAGLFSQYFSCITNPINCLAPPPQSNITRTGASFTSFITPDFISSGSTFTILGSNTPSDFIFTLKDNANAPLGPSHSTEVNVSASCGSDPICDATIGNGVSVTTPTPTILQGETVQQTIALTLNCPSKSSGVTLPAQAQLGFIFVMPRYTAASIIPIILENKSYYNQLVSSQAVTAPSTAITQVYASPGPVYISPTIQEPQPILTGNNQLPILININNGGTGTYAISTLAVIFNSQVLPSIVNTGSIWTCAPLAGQQNFYNFVFSAPGSTPYTECKYNFKAAGAQSNSSSSFALSFSSSNLNGALNQLHFNTIPVLFYMNYSYSQSTQAAFIVRSGIQC